MAKSQAPQREADAKARLTCSHCSWQAEPANLAVCPQCGASLSVVYTRLPAPDSWITPEPGIWRYRRLLPIAPQGRRVSLGEGGTSLLPAPLLDPSGRLWLKNETTNPTASFKDRPVAVALTVAVQQGLLGVICASTGNTGVAVAAYAARADLPAVCLVPEATPAPKLLQIEAVGARIIRVRGTYSDAYALAQAAAEQYGWANLTSTYINPYMLEGDKTVAYEIFEQLGSRCPEWIIVPVGAGPLLGAIAKGFAELRAMELASDACPRLVAAQAAGCAPIAKAFEIGADQVQTWEGAVETMASSIADPLRGYSADGTRTLQAVRESNGLAIAVSEDEITTAIRRLARCEGLVVEAGAAVSLAAYDALASRGLFGPQERVVLLLTGHGLKDPRSLQVAAQRDPDMETSFINAGDVQGLGNILEA